jgi:hypothetical protein
MALLDLAMWKRKSASVADFEVVTLLLNALNMDPFTSNPSPPLLYSHVPERHGDC